MVKTKEPQQRRFREFKEFVLEQLQDPEFAIAYLNESLKEESQDNFLASLKNVVEARSGDIASVAEEAQLSRQNVYRILSKEGNPTLTSVRSLLHVLGLELAVQPYSATIVHKKNRNLN
jgi:probable addiction module antidote protein